jgi:hypothetical protein
MVGIVRRYLRREDKRLSWRHRSVVKAKGTPMAATRNVPGPCNERNAGRAHAYAEFETLLAWITNFSGSVRAFEPDLWRHLCSLAVRLFQLWLAERQSRLVPNPAGPTVPIERTIQTRFGPVPFQRSYVRRAEGGGYFPLDQRIGLHPDSLSPHLAGLGARMATRMSFEDASEVLGWFLPRTIPGSTLQKAALGLGAHAAPFLDDLPAPQDDGEVVVVQVDAKCLPTATDAELRKRRGPRAGKPRAASPRHRGRSKRVEREPRRRRRPGDKSKNGRQVMVVVVYTLHRQGDLLLGPLNKRVFSVVGPKELGFVWARAELERRGFGPTAKGKVVQVLTDGDPDLQALATTYMPHAQHTLDVYHALEYVAEAGHVLFGKDHHRFDLWWKEAKSKVLQGKVGDVLDELRQAYVRVPRTGPGTKQTRLTLTKVLDYLGKREGMMNYGQLDELDMDIGSGAVEGAVKYLVAARFDHGGMRWLRERANALLQLRCLDENGVWDQFLAHVFDGPDAVLSSSTRILRSTPAPLPTLESAA